MPTTNRPHFHPWFLATTGRIFYKARAGDGFFTRQAAGQWAKRRQPDPARRLVLQCDVEACRPRLD